MYIGTQMKKLRQARNMTLKELAGETGIEVPCLSSIERNRQEISMFDAFEIANALNTTIGDLLSENNVYAGIDTCAYCGAQYHPMMRYSNGKRIICVCSPGVRRAMGQNYPGCNEQADAEGFYPRPELTPGR
jgi:DNA-binding XRE family transcriptional regulator